MFEKMCRPTPPHQAPAGSCCRRRRRRHVAGIAIRIGIHAQVDSKVPRSTGNVGLPRTRHQGQVRVKQQQVSLKMS